MSIGIGVGSGGSSGAGRADWGPTIEVSKKTIKESVHAYSFLESAVKEMKDRAAQRDTTHDKGHEAERSMAATVKAFNALTGHNLSEENGWEFMILLKLVRGRQGAFRMDDYTDAAAYSALLGECASLSR